MGFSLARLGLLTILWSCHLPGLAFGAQRFLDQLSSVHCGFGEMSFSLPLGFEAFAADIAILDNEDQTRSFQNDSACGLWIGEGMETTLLVTATYDGCYIRKEDEDYVMTVIVDRLADGELDHHKRDIKCPIEPALDAPSASHCAAIPTSDRLACANNLVSRDVCEAMGCCFSPDDPSLPCYFGNKVTARCTDGQALVAISKDMTAPSLVLDSVHVVNVDSTSCPGLSILKTSAFVAFAFPLSCGGKQVSGSEMVYENIFEATKETRTWHGVSITRDSTMRLMVRCHHSQAAAAPLMVEVVTLPPPPPISTTGPLFLEMRIAKDPQYSSYYRDTDYPLVKGLRNLVFLEVRILRRKDPSLVLILNDCWATPSTDPTQQMQWSILVDGCPSADEDVNYLTRLSPVGTDIDFPNHYKRFVVNAFIFVEQQTYTAFGEEVYFHCSASVCIPSAGNPCTTSCSTRQKRAAKAPLEQITVSKGPVNFIAIEKYPDVKDNMSIEMENLSEMELPMFPEEFWDLEMLNETDESFVGAEEGPIDGDLFDADKLMPRRVKDDTNAKFDFLLWLKGAAVGGGILLVVVTMLGIWKCNRRPRPTMHTVKV